MIYVLIPTYNEEDNIAGLALDLNTLEPHYDLYHVFSDDGSNDQTLNEINTHFSDKNTHVITKEKNIGPGDCFNKGFEWIINQGLNENDKILTIEADQTSDIATANRMIKISNLGFDLVLASVYAQGGTLEKTSWLKKGLSFTANMLFRLLFDIKIQTMSSFYRVYSGKLILALHHRYGSICTEKGFVCKLEILKRSIALDSSMIEVPTKLMSNRRKGKSKMKIFKTTLNYMVFLVKNKW